jgi:hypothetical protein
MQLVINRVVGVLNYWHISKDTHCAQLGVIILHIKPLLNKFNPLPPGFHGIRAVHAKLKPRGLSSYYK